LAKLATQRGILQPLRVISRTKSLTGDKIEVWQKRQNTLDFLDVAKRATEEHFARVFGKAT